MHWPDAEKLKKWRPIALLLLGAALVSAFSTYAGLYSQVKNWLSPTAPYTVIAGYFHLNGQSSENAMLSVGEDEAEFAFYDVTLNLSRATFATERFVEQCRDIEFSEVRGNYRIITTIHGSVTPEFPKQNEELDIFCGDTLLTVDLLSEPTLDTHTLGQEFYSFSGLFEITAGYTVNTLTRLHLREIEISPDQEKRLREISAELWDKIGPAV